MDWKDELENMLTEILRNGVSRGDLQNEIDNIVTRHYEPDCFESDDD